MRTALTQLLGEPVSVEMATDYDSLIGLARAGAADLVWAPAVVCSRLESEAAAIYKTVRDGRTSYRSALMARRDAHVSLANLGGKRAAWVDRTSIGGYLLVIEHLRSLGIDPRSFAEERFVGSYPAALKAVLDGDADVCAVFVPDHRQELVERALGPLVGAARVAQLNMLLVTRASPNDAFLVTRALPDARRDEVIARLFPQGAARARPTPLCLAMEVDGFERAEPGDYAGVRGLWTRP